MKAYTSLEQSKQLAEILPLESADMSWTRAYYRNHPKIAGLYRQFCCGNFAAKNDYVQLE